MAKVIDIVVPEPVPTKIVVEFSQDEFDIISGLVRATSRGFDLSYGSDYNWKLKPEYASQIRKLHNGLSQNESDAYVFERKI